MRHITVISKDHFYEVWDMAQKAPVAHFDNQTAAATFAGKLRQAWGAGDQAYTASFQGNLSRIPWTIEYTGEQYGWVIEDCDGRYIASVNTLENATRIRKAMGAEQPPINEYTEAVLGRGFKPNELR